MPAVLDPAVKAPQATPAIEATKIGSDMQVGISQFGSWMLGVGAIIGSMAWLFHGPMIAQAGQLASLTAWILAFFIALPLALIVAELSSMFPTAGGPYVYKYYAFKRLLPGTGELIGFLTGWLFWICMIAGLGCMANGLTNLLSTTIWGSANASPIWFGPVVIFSLMAVTTALNLMQVGSAAKLNNVFTLMKFAMALAFGSLVFMSHSSSLANAWNPVSPAGNTNFWFNVSSVLMVAIAGFGGVELAGCTSSETKNAQKSVPRAILATLVSVAVLYIGMNLAISAATPYVLSPDKTTMVVPGTMIQATVPAITGFLAGSGWGMFMTFAVVASIVGCGFSGLLATGRVAYSMAETGLFPAQFGKLDPKTKVPTYALSFQFFCLSIVGITANLLSRTGLFADAYAFLATVFGFMYAFLALLYGFCLLSLRYTDKQMSRPFRLGKKGNALAWCMVIVTTVVYGYAAFGCTPLIDQLFALVLLVAGVPIYYWYKARRPATANIED